MVAHASVSPFVMWRAVTHACGPYNIPNVRVGEVYYSNNACASMRGFGSAATFTVERHMDQIAKAIGMNPAELRVATCCAWVIQPLAARNLGRALGST